MSTAAFLRASHCFPYSLSSCSASFFRFRLMIKKNRTAATAETPATAPPPYNNSSSMVNSNAGTSLLACRTDTKVDTKVHFSNHFDIASEGGICYIICMSLSDCLILGFFWLVTKVYFFPQFFIFTGKICLLEGPDSHFALLNSLSSSDAACFSWSASR